MLTIATVCLVLLMIASYSAAADQPCERDWHFGFSAVYSSRSLSGDVVNRTALTDNVFGNLMATGDSMNVGSSNDFILAAGVQYKRWGLGLNYMPTSFNGEGWALVNVSGTGAGVVMRTALNTDVDVDILLGNLVYNFIQTPNAVFGVGVGLGKTDIDLKIIPRVGNAIIYRGNQPFGFLNMHMANTYKRFLYGFSINGISATFDGVKVNYSDYKIDLGYRAIDGKVKCDLVGGYRMVNFALDIEYGAEVVATDMTLEGPFLGVSLIY